MMKLSNIKYLIMFGIVSWVILPVLDVLGVPKEHKLNDVFGLVSATFWYIMLFVVLTAFIICNRQERKSAFLKLLGTGHYKCWWTIVLLPCIVYAFFCDYDSYAIVCSSLIVILEYFRTVQNSYSDEYYLEQVKKKFHEVNL